MPCNCAGATARGPPCLGRGVVGPEPPLLRSIASSGPPSSPGILVGEPCRQTDTVCSSSSDSPKSLTYLPGYCHQCPGYPPLLSLTLLRSCLFHHYHCSQNSLSFSFKLSLDDPMSLEECPSFDLDLECDLLLLLTRDLVSESVLLFSL